jgi:hypothetical protein
VQRVTGDISDKCSYAELWEVSNYEQIMSANCHQRRNWFILMNHCNAGGQISVSSIKAKKRYNNFRPCLRAK